MILEMLQSGRYQKFVDKVRGQLSIQCTQMFNELKAQVGDLVLLNDPAGGPCLWIGLPEGFSSKDLWHYLIKFNLAIAPGCMFIDAIKFDNYFRVTYGLPWNEKMKAGIVDLAFHIKVFLGKV